MSTAADGLPLLGDTHFIDMRSEEGQLTLTKINESIEKVNKKMEDLSGKVNEFEEKLRRFSETQANNTGNMDDIERRRQEIENVENVAGVVLPVPAPPRGTQQREEPAIRRKEQAAIRTELYKAGQHFAQCLFPLVAIIAGGFQVVDLSRTLAILLGVLVGLIVLLLGSSCLLKMWLLYREDEDRVPCTKFLLALPFLMDLVALVGGAIGLFVIFGIGAVGAKRAKHMTVGWMAE